MTNKQANSHRAKRGSSKTDDRRLEEVLNAFRRISRALRLAAVEMQNRFDVSAAQLYILDELANAGEALSINDLAARTMTDRTSVTGVVRHLEKKRYVTRSRAVEDLRRMEVRLTSAGSRVVKAAPPAPTLRLIEALQRLSRGELRMLAIGLQRVSDELGLASTRAEFLFEENSGSPKTRARRRSS